MEIFQLSVHEPVLIFSRRSSQFEKIARQWQEIGTNQLPYLRSKSTSLWTYTVINLPSITTYMNIHREKRYLTAKEWKQITRADTTLVTVIKHYVLGGTLCKHKLDKTFDNYVTLMNTNKQRHKIMLGQELTYHGGHPDNAADELHQQWPEHVLLFPG